MATLPPSLGSIAFRRYSGEDDFPGLLAAYNASRLADGASGIETLEAFTNDYRHLTNCDLDTDLLVAETPGGIVGYARVTWWVEDATNDRVLLGVVFLDPAGRGTGAAEVMHRWTEERLGEIAGERPHTGASFFTAYLDQGETERDRVLAEAGYTRTQTYAEMNRSLADPIPDLALPAGVEVRPTTVADARRVWEADDRAFQDHVGYAPQTETDYQRWLLSHYLKEPGLWKVAFDSTTGEIAGQVLNYVNHEENAMLGRAWGWTESISVQREWRRRGLAKALIARSMAMFRDLGYSHVALGVHTTNPNGAFPLYEGLGYRVTHLGWEVRKPLPADG